LEDCGDEDDPPDADEAGRGPAHGTRADEPLAAPDGNAERDHARTEDVQEELLRADPAFDLENLFRFRQVGQGQRGAALPDLHRFTGFGHLLPRLCFLHLDHESSSNLDAYADERPSTRFAHSKRRERGAATDSRAVYLPRRGKGVLIFDSRAAHETRAVRWTRAEQDQAVGPRPFGRRPVYFPRCPRALVFSGWPREWVRSSEPKTSLPSPPPSMLSDRTWRPSRLLVRPVPGRRRDGGERLRHAMCAIREGAGLGAGPPRRARGRTDRHAWRTAGQEPRRVRPGPSDDRERGDLGRRDGGPFENPPGSFRT